MEISKFNDLKKEFANSNTDKKIEIYSTTPGLSQEQYKELLKLYPYNEIDKLEKALS